ncbi:putative Exodeoxyribonuclease V [Methanocaldococcus lauensis]|uniref:Putative Exodeoxyribonuclease V n=1 Tax=Methanocaldococcus lauensis TaxID=2546128 RepID=A0A8D6PXG6_9EURY|nr:AAA family ATPase [Methanocaldococcus lauensis]CAB3289126.1 putative Exodeoxyribonuclease V [Methanocaldococcus lauensis]
MHLTTLIAWHDSGWNGKICRNPKANKYCESFRYIKKGKFGLQYGNKPIEKIKCENNAGKIANEVEYNGKKWDACGNEINLFYQYKFNSMVYGWTVNKKIDVLKDIFLDYWFNFYYNNDALCFLYCRENPVIDDKLLVACVKPKVKKLVVECNLNKNKKVISKEIEEQNFNKLNNEEFYKSLFKDFKDKDYRKIYPYISIEFDPEDIIFIIPYQELGEYFGYENIPEELILDIPNELKKSFLYTTNFLPNEFSCIILEKALEIIKNIKNLMEEHEKLKKKLKEFRNIEIEKYEERIKKQLDELKKLKIKYPSLPSVLRFCGVEEAISMYIDAVKNGKEDEMYNEVKEYLKENKPNPNWKIDRMVLNNFNKLSNSKHDFLLNYIPYYSLTKSQIEEIFKQHDKGFINIEKVLDNPYLLYEELKPKEQLFLDISFWELDSWERRRLGEDNFDIINKHRIRALLIAILKKALLDGHTVLPLAPKDLPSVKKDLKYYYNEINKYISEKVRLDFDRFLELIDKHEDYIKEKIWIDKTTFKDELDRTYNIKLFALKDIRKMEVYIEEKINKMLGKYWNVEICEEEIKEKLKKLKEKKSINIPKELYKEAIKDQSKAIKTLLENGCSILTGPAGTGKTTVIKVLLDIICEKENPKDIVILTPTGKAGVRVKDALEDIINKYKCIKSPTTIHKFIKDCSRFDWEYKEFEITTKKDVDILIIDEASMVGTELLYKLLQCIDLGKLKRIIFIGDVNQLPPVEAGKPFFDLYQYLKRKENKDKQYIAELKICLRAESRKIVEFSELFLNINKESKYKIIKELKLSEEVMNGFTKYSLKDEKGIERITVLIWKDNSQKAKALEYAIDEIIRDYGGNPDNYRDFFKCFVYYDKAQILTYTKNRGFLSSYWINQWIRDDSKYINESIRNYFIRYQFTCGWGYADKVIQTENIWNLDVWDYKRQMSISNHGVFNGMMGYVSFTRYKDRVVKFYFPTVQAYIGISKNTKEKLINYLKRNYKSLRYKNKEELMKNLKNKFLLNTEKLEYAYAITTHKSQGSEFENVIFVLPKYSNISKELIYTAITRAKKKLYIITDSLDSLFNAGKYSEVIGRYSILFNSPIDPRHYPEDLRIITLKGDIVRSWQECLIANLLYYEGIDYKYEIPYENLIPDFMINNKEDKIILWEHLGMMDNEEYKKNAEEKLKVYENNGFYIIKIRDIDTENFKKVFEENDKLLIVSTTDDIRNSRELYDKIKILKDVLNT